MNFRPSGIVFDQIQVLQDCHSHNTSCRRVIVKSSSFVPESAKEDKGTLCRDMALLLCNTLLHCDKAELHKDSDADLQNIT